MLRFLRIEHLAVIDELEVEFDPHLNVLTGETGAGKSMLVEAVGLLLGGRASADLIRTGETQATVQAVFDAAGQPLGELIVRREVTSQGRSRAFVNDVLVTAAALHECTAPLVELHGQHEHQTLMDPESHLDLLDDFGGFRSARDGVAASFRRWKDLQNQFDAFQLDERERAARIDLLRFQSSELERANLRAGEDDELETAKRLLTSADKVKRLSSEAYSALYDADEAALTQLGHVWKRVAELAEIDPSFRAHVEARDGIKAQLQDLASALRATADNIDAPPQKLQEVEDRLALLQRLKRKYGPSLDDVIAARESTAIQLDGLLHADERRSGLAADLERARAAFLDCANALSLERHKAAKAFSTQLESLLSELAMPRARLDVRFQSDVPTGAWSARGIDIAECFFSANVGEDLRPLARIASGGELSRVMLAIRTLSAAGQLGKTLIFDEIDAGIGGRVADVVGRRLRALGRDFQVLCITHLPQIAAQGDSHFEIVKAVRSGRTETRVSRLDARRRVEEVARMIGGAAATPASLAAAQELLDSGEAKSKGESERAKAKVRRAGLKDPQNTT